MMVASKKLNVVLDIGKTNVKLTFVDSSNNKALYSFRTKQENIIRHSIKILNSNSIYEWALTKIVFVGRKYSLDKFVCTAHGTSIALIGEQNQEILACTDYEYKFDKIFDHYKRLAPNFNESFTPFLENGLNIGQQIYYLYKKNPKMIKNTKFILTYPQYIAWKLSGNFSSEISYLGCHTHLWDFKKNKLSSFVKKLRLENKFPPMRKAWEVIGQKKIANSNLQIVNGVHDSNASYLYFKNSNIKNFTLVTTGTWYIIFNQKTSLTNLNPNLDMLANIDVFGKPVPTIRFMGGREYDNLMKVFKITTNTKALKNFNYKNYLIYPSYASGGAFINKKININFFKKLKKGQIYYLICLYIAFVINFSLNKMKSSNTIILDGPITKNITIMKILSSLRPKQLVLKNKKEIGTTLGATNLFNIKKKNKLQTVDIPKYQNQSMKSSYKLWEEDLYKKELFSHS
ncbi:MAG: FGGY-family carbohydrate kinase [Alphaproteobacteria bacterium]|jgi:sugar (pentulose or hexulose) kinase|tara:strand:+ start:2337 stop:3710 length:1374 start_codon:yes stop_codon:yes gene_type:complete